MPNNNTRYQQSIAAEFIALKDRVKFFIDDNHWGEDGRYKEIILMNFLRRVLPDNVAVGTGFVKNRASQLTDQIDIIIYKKNEPKLFSEGDFVILMPESVLGIIEVKSKVTPQVLHGRKKYEREVLSTIDKCHLNGEVIGRTDIFNGIFSYEKQMSFRGGIQSNKLIDQLKEKQGYINHICFDDNIFMRYWPEGNPTDMRNENRPSLSFYDLSYEKVFHQPNTTHSGLAFGYFISNLLETVYRLVASNVLNEQYFEFLYPLEHTKEVHRMRDCEIRLN
ncbi:DUF6602 domain-containing protein [Paenibacillus sp. NPDC058177]|uniref:DUF6602 domain-containing protein n=1 Tax=Paenibacillus sp. NPDC058177 TaxID=3346369 RepID=UPI0036DCC71C